MALLTSSSTFSATGTTNPFMPKSKNGCTASITGTFSATINVEKRADGASGWQVMKTLTAAGTVNLGEGVYRFNCTAYTSGSPVCAFTEADETFIEYRDSLGGLLFQVNRSGIVTNAAIQAATETATQGFTLSGIETGITALANGGQAGATPLSATKSIHVVATVTNLDDSVMLPPASAGAVHIVKNSAANDVQVFGQLTETINGVASATGVTVAGHASAIFVGIAAGQWFMVLGN